MEKFKEKHHEITEMDVGHFNDCPWVDFGWVGSSGWGRLTMFYDPTDDTWSADTEHMCSNDDKSFLEELFADIIKKIRIDG